MSSSYWLGFLRKGVREWQPGKCFDSFLKPAVLSVGDQEGHLQSLGPWGHIFLPYLFAASLLVHGIIIAKNGLGVIFFQIMV